MDTQTLQVKTPLSRNTKSL